MTTQWLELIVLDSLRQLIYEENADECFVSATTGRRGDPGEQDGQPG